MSINKGLKTVLLLGSMWYACCYCYAQNNDNRNTSELHKANEYINIADSLVQIGELETAIEYTEKAVRTYTLANNWKNSLKAYNKIGYRLARTQKLDESIEILQKGRQLGLEKLGESHLIMADTYNYLATAYRKKGNYRNALTLYKKAIAIQEQKYGSNHPTLGQTYYNIGSAYYFKGDYENSLKFNQKALNIQLQIYQENNPTVGATYSNIGLINRALNDYDAALNAFTKTAQIWQNVYHNPNNPKMSSVYTDLLIVYTKQKKYNLAQEYANKALKILNETFEANHPDFITVYQTLGSMYLEQNRYDKALQYYKEALTRQKQVLENNHPDLADSYIKLGSVYEAQQLYTDALNKYQQALVSLVSDFTDSTDIKKNPKLTPDFSGVHLLNALKAKARVLQKQYKTDNNTQTLYDALDVYVLSTKLIDKMVTTYEGIAPKTFKLNENLWAYENGIDVAYYLYQKDTKLNQKDKLINTAFMLSEKRKKVQLIEQIKDLNDNIFYEVPIALINEEINLKINRSFYKNELLNVQQKGDFANPKTIQNLQNTITQIENDFQNLVLTFKNTYPNYYNLKYNTKVATINSVQNILNNKVMQSSMVVYSMHDSIAYCFVVNKNNARWFAINDAQNVQKQAESFVSGIYDYEIVNKTSRNNVELFTQNAFNLYQNLFEKVENHNDQIDRALIIIPEKSIVGLPFEALIYQKANGTTSYQNLNYLINRYMFSYDYSATSFCERLSNQYKYSGKRLSFGSNYDRRQLTLAADKMITQLANVSDIELNNAVEEGQIMADIVQGNLWHGNNATEKNFKTYAPNANLVHIALHLLIDDSKVLDSKILFATPNDKTSKEDGFLNVHELYNLPPLNNELLFLGAIKDATPKKNKKTHYGILQLMHALHFSQCNRNILNLWRAKDSNNDLVKQFYKQITKGIPTVDAAHKAKMYFVNHTNPEKTHPYFWAGLYVVGNPNAVSTYTNFMFWGLLMALIGLIGGSWFALMRSKKIQPNNNNNNTTI